MSAQPNPDPSPRNKHRDLITRFREEYATALHEADVSRQHTGTEGWQKLYAAQRKSERESRRELAGTLKRSAEQMEAIGLSEDGEKELAAVKKQSESLRERVEHFDLQAIQPVRDPVERCRKLMDEARRAARAEEERTPLVNAGLEELMKDAIAGVDKPRWDDESGRVEILPATGEVS